MGENQDTITIGAAPAASTTTPQAQLEALRAANPGKIIVRLVRLGVSTSNVVLNPGTKLEAITSYLASTGENLSQLKTFVNNETEDGTYQLEDGDIVSLVKNYDNGTI